MDILTNKIQLAVTDEEANVILSAVSRFRGIYENTELKHPADLARHKRSIVVAERMRDTLEAELLERYHNSQANNAITQSHEK
jgi:hypothetical protein